jgi:hypothetical protein
LFRRRILTPSFLNSAWLLVPLFVALWMFEYLLAVSLTKVGVSLRHGFSVSSFRASAAWFLDVAFFVLLLVVDCAFAILLFPFAAAFSGFAGAIFIARSAESLTWFHCVDPLVFAPRRLFMPVHFFRSVYSSDLITFPIMRTAVNFPRVEVEASAAFFTDTSGLNRVACIITRHFDARAKDFDVPSAALAAQTLAASLTTFANADVLDAGAPFSLDILALWSPRSNPSAIIANTAAAARSADVT